MKLVAMVGSIRKDSYNKRLANFIQNRYKEKIEIEILPIDQLPFFNEDEEFNPPEIVKVVKSKISYSDGVLFVTPEFNHSVPGVLKNAIDWLSRVDQVMVNKPVMIVGASRSVLGTARAQMHLRQILNSPGISALTLPGNEVFVGVSHDKINGQGHLTHEPTIQFIDQVMDNFVKWIENTKMFK